MDSWAFLRAIGAVAILVGLHCSCIRTYDNQRATHGYVSFKLSLVSECILLPHKPVALLSLSPDVSRLEDVELAFNVVDCATDSGKGTLH